MILQKITSSKLCMRCIGLVKLQHLRLLSSVVDDNVRQAIASPLFHINGRRVGPINSASQDDISVLEPATGKQLCVTRAADAQDVSRAVESATSGGATWSQLSAADRSNILLETARLIRERSKALAEVECVDTGKPIWEARVDIEGCADTVQYAAALARLITGQHIPLSAGSFAYTRREPLGVVGGIGAWNYPFQMAVWKSAPALACGNTMVFKPSPLTPLTAVMLADIYTEAGLPPGAFNVVQGAGETGQLLCEHPQVAKVTFTGSVQTGAHVMAACSQGIKPVTLELGGKSPLIVFEDCDLNEAVKGTMMANFINQGQVCSNGTRVFVYQSIAEEFVKCLADRTRRMNLGSPYDEDTHIGAIISGAHAEKVLSYIEGARQQGAHVVCGGERVVPADPSLAGGHYLSPCILTDLRDDMTVVQEEIFGAVACILPFSSEEEVIKRAIDTDFGLAGGVFTRDLNRAHRIASALQCGNVYVNNYNIYPSELPFGGSKKSGIGRENGSAIIEQLTQVKSVYVEGGEVWCPY